MSQWIQTACLLGAMLLSTVAQAHKASDSYLRLKVDGAQIQGQWDIALRDLQVPLVLDANQNGEITWGEVRSRHQGIADYALTRLTLRSAGKTCLTKVDRQLIDRHADGAYIVLQFTANCPTKVQQLEADYRLLFDVDRQHRGLLQLVQGGISSSAVFSPKQPVQKFQLGQTSRLQQFSDYLKEGIWHIANGYDHILFLVALLLPAVLRREHTGWQPVATLPVAVRETLKIVTAFTLAHSLTLSLATLGVIRLPTPLVEAAIAASVLLTALDNLVPLFRGPRWWIAFGFGLIHGFGFATVLGELGLTTSSLLLSLLSFNLGVEAGQLLIVATLLPLLYWLRLLPLYPRAVLGGGSLVTASLAFTWLVERVANVSLIPG